jgi:hypothetical protein
VGFFLLPGSKNDTCQHGDPGAGKLNPPGTPCPLFLLRSCCSLFARHKWMGFESGSAQVQSVSPAPQYIQALLSQIQRFGIAIRKAVLVALPRYSELLLRRRATVQTRAGPHSRASREDGRQPSWEGGRRGGVGAALPSAGGGEEERLLTRFGGVTWVRDGEGGKEEENFAGGARPACPYRDDRSWR